MMKHALLFAVAFLLASPAGADDAASKKKRYLGAQVPVISSIDLEGNLVGINELLGEDSWLPPEARKSVVLITFTVPCKACEDEVSLIKELRDEFKGKPVEFIYMNVGNSSKIARKFVKANKLDFKVWLDEEQMNFFQLLDTYSFRKAFPVTFIFNRDGYIVGKPLVGLTPPELIRRAIRYSLLTE